MWVTLAWAHHESGPGSHHLRENVKLCTQLAKQHFPNTIEKVPLDYVCIPRWSVSHFLSLIIVNYDDKKKIPFFKPWKKILFKKFFWSLRWHYLCYSGLKISLIFMPITKPSFLLRTTLISEIVFPWHYLGGGHHFPRKVNKGIKTRRLKGWGSMFF